MRLVLPFVVVLLASSTAAALRFDLTDADLARAAGLARWPHTDADRANFHQRYTFTINGTASPVGAERIEVITEFRRLERIAEEHARMNDLFGRGGVADAREALRAWRGRVSVVAHLQLALLNTFIGVPPIDITLTGPGPPVLPLDVKSSPVYTYQDPPTLVGAVVEAIYDAKSVGQTMREAIVSWNTKELARVMIDFASLE